MDRASAVHMMQYRRSARQQLRDSEPSGGETPPRDRFEALIFRLEGLVEFRLSKEDASTSHGYLDVPIGSGHEQFTTGIHIGYLVQGGMHIPQEMSVTFLDPTSREIIAAEGVTVKDLETGNTEALRMLKLLEQTVKMVESEQKEKAATS